MSAKFQLYLLSLILFLVTACSKDDPAPTTGKLLGNVADATTQSAIAGAYIIVFNADDNAPTGTALTSDADGNFSIDLLPGNYFLKVYKQDYDAMPSAGMEAVPFSITVGTTTEQSVEMTPATDTNTGYISGKVTGNDVGGVLVVAEHSVNEVAYSSVSDKDGNYTIFNVPAGTYDVKGFKASYNSSTATASVTADMETTEVGIELSTGAAGTLSGSVRNIAASNLDVDVSLVHPLTRETIPGLVTQTTALTYTIANIPDGTYIARATFKNDDRVMDPDRIAKFGEPVVTFAANTIELTFDITGSITLNSPTNEATTTQPVETSVAPTFTWTAYSSTSDYVIEVIDAATGAVIWGGFDNSGSLPVKNIVIPSSQQSITFNSDGNATISELIPGRTYRWRIFASKNDQNSDTGWTLISASEDQRGLIKIVE
jgi:hypothetical protein